MSFACDACHKNVPASNEQAGWIAPCPWCGGSLTFLGLKAESSAVQEAPNPLTHAEP